MPRDYKHPSRKQRVSRTRAPRRWPWLFGGLAIGFLAGYAAYFVSTHGGPEKAAQVAQRPAAPAPKTATKAKPEADKNSGENRFKFYDMLPEMEVKIPKEALDAPARDGAQKPERDGLYILQVGSFRSMAEADRLKAQLAFMGVESSIQSVIISNDSTWYRVQVGPKQLRELQQARAALERNNVGFMLLKLGA